MKLLYGKPIADEILERLKSAILLSDEKPGLAVVLIGNDEASHLYVNLKEKAAKEIGMEFYKYLIPEVIAESDVLKLVELLNNDENIHGIIVQLPLPAGFDTEKIIKSIDPKKDADGFSTHGVLLPVFPRAIIKMVEGSGENVSGKNAIVIAKSEQFGQAMIAALEQQDIPAEYILAEDIPSNLGKIQGADIVISAVGSQGLLSGEMFKEGVIVIDGGIEKVGEKIVGDVDFASTKAKNGFLTPVPKGVGPVTIACLLENVYLAFKAQQKE